MEKVFRFNIIGKNLLKERMVMEEQKNNDAKTFLVVGAVVFTLVLIGVVFFLFFTPA